MSDETMIIHPKSLDVWVTINGACYNVAQYSVWYDMPRRDRLIVRALFQAALLDLDGIENAERLKDS